jgi:hypothetical protein
MAASCKPEPAVEKSPSLRFHSYMSLSEPIIPFVSPNEPLTRDNWPAHWLPPQTVSAPLMPMPPPAPRPMGGGEGGRVRDRERERQKRRERTLENRKIQLQRSFVPRPMSALAPLPPLNVNHNVTSSRLTPRVMWTTSPRKQNADHLSSPALLGGQCTVSSWSPAMRPLCLNDSR